MPKFIFKSEIDFFKTDGKYNWRIWTKMENADESEWVICAFDSANTPNEAYNDTQTYLKTLKY